MKREHFYKKEKTIFNYVGDELYPSQIKPGGVYSVEVVLKDKVAERLGIKKNQWGIIVLDHKGDIIRSWNVFHTNAWSTTKYKIDNSWHIFQAPEIMRQFADRSWDADTANAHCKALEEKMREDNLLRYHHDRHWLRRFTNWLINMF